jgi:Zn-dependent peptidase ImmA (M78 family)
MWRTIRSRVPRLAAFELLNIYQEAGVMDSGIAVDVFAIASWLGIKVYRVSHDLDRPPWVGVLDTREEDVVMWVRQHDRIEDQRLCLACGLGHLLLHPHGKMYHLPMGDTWTEALGFGVELLIPALRLGEVAHRVRDIRGRARVFRVTEGLMASRMLALGYR